MDHVVGRHAHYMDYIAGVDDDALLAQCVSIIAEVRWMAGLDCPDDHVAQACWVECCRRGKPDLWRQALETVKARERADREQNERARTPLSG